MVSDYLLTALILALTDGLAAVGLTLLAGFAGQVSLGHMAFAGIGAYTSAILSARFGLNPWLAMLPATAITGLAAALVGAPLLRLRGHYLALGTLGLGLVISSAMKELTGLTGGPSGFAGIPRLALFGHPLSTLEYFGVTALMALAAGWLLTRLVRSRTGRLLQATRDSEIGAEMTGIDARRLKLQIFTLSAVLAALSGSLYVHFVTFISPGPFEMLNSLKLLVIATLGGMRSIPGAWIGAGALTLLMELVRDVVPRLLPNAGGEQQMITYGLLMVLVLVYLPDGITGAAARLVARFRSKARRPQLDRAPSSPAASPAAIWESLRPARLQPLEVSRVAVSFGGFAAVRDVSFTAAPGEVTAIIGPNGAGKTTLFNLICGLVHPTAGEIRWGGRSLRGLSPNRLARLGLGRTFQNIRLFTHMTALENVMVGVEAAHGPGVLASMLRFPQVVRAEAQTAARARELLAVVGLAGEASTKASHLPFGKQRMLELARALAIRPRLLLLDEPASGLTSQEERDALVAVIRSIREAGISVILVDHDMRFVMSLADRVVVLAGGQRIAEGTPDRVQSDPNVIQAYLGEAASASEGGTPLT